MTSPSAARWCCAAAAVLAIHSSPARAEESPSPPRHLAPYGLDWLNYISPDDIPATRYATCIVDTGTAITPDTPADSASGPIVERLSTDGGPGTPLGDAPEQQHGTRMAMDAIAVPNRWGTVGTVGWGRVVSVRAQVGNELTLREDAYRKGVSRCVEAEDREAIASISLSFGCACSFSADEEARIEDAVQAAREGGLSVVAAAGNGSGSTESPARFDGVLAVAGGAGDGELCSYSSYDDRVAIVGPACPVDDADPLTGIPAYSMGAGSSAATVTVASFIAALRTLRPDATAADVEGWLRDSARTVSGRRVLDGEAAARSAGLGGVIDRARARIVASTPAAGQPAVVATVAPTPKPSVTQTGRPPKRLPPPHRVRVRWRRGHLTISASGRPRGALLHVRAEHLGEFGLVDRSRARTRPVGSVSLRLRWRPDRAKVRFVAGRGDTAYASRVRILRRSANGHFK